MYSDTQIVSYYFSGALPLSPFDGVQISSITAAEFLLVQTTEPTRARYYPLLPARYGHVGAVAQLALPDALGSRKHAERGKNRTDQLLLDFGSTYPALIEYGGMALTQLINEKQERLYAASIAHLQKTTRKLLREKFTFLLDHNFSCTAVTPQVADIGLELLSRFTEKYTPKGNLRNTVNDVLVLATAISNEAALRTEDKLLNRFAQEVTGARSEMEGALMTLDFTPAAVTSRRPSLESKGYINRGWRIATDNRSRAGR